MKLTALESENFSWLGCGPCFKFNNFWCPCSFIFSCCFKDDIYICKYIYIYIYI
jgi:hypothetical protein